MARKLKFRSAAEKRKHEENQASWESLLNKYKPTKVHKNAKPIETKLYTRDTPEISSLKDWVTGPVNFKTEKKYTGDAMIGIATMHKSNAVPVFNDSQAKDLASMRR